jgi:tetratricopeptide (TPR) repeat protein
MNRSRKTDLTVGAEAFSVHTALVGGESPAIESRVLLEGRVVYSTRTDAGVFVPLSKHVATISRWIDTQHETIMARLQDGTLSIETVMNAAEALLQAGLADALSRMAVKDFAGAAIKLRKILEQEPSSAEARHLLEVAGTCASGEPPPPDTRRRLKAGAEAFAAGSTKRALEFWKTCLASDPASRIYQCLVLLATAETSSRREQYAQEVVSLGGQLLTEGYPEEAHALLTVAQSVEQSSSPALDGLARAASARTLKPPPQDRPAGKVTPPRPHPETVAESPGTNPRALAAPEEPWSPPHRSRHRHFAARNLKSLPLPTPFFFGISAALLALLIVGVSLTTLESRAEPVELLEQAFATLNAGQYTEATEAYSRILANWDNVPSAHLGRGRARLALGDLEGGLADLTRAVELEPGAPTSAEELADVLFVRGRFQEATEYYRRAIEAGSENPDALYRFAASLVQLDRGDEALDPLRAAIERDPSHAEAQLLMGTILNAGGRHAEAERSLRAARSNIQASGDYFAELGLALVEQEKLVGAEEVAREFLRLDPGDERAHTLLGEVFLHQRDYDAARVELIRALQINERDPRARIALGRTWLGIGKTESDRNALAKARQILETAQGVPEGERILVLGQVALAERSLREAITLLEQCIGIGAEELPARLSLAEARFAARDYPGAARELERAGTLSSTDPAIPLSLAVTYSELEDSTRASGEYWRTTRLLPPPNGETLVLPHPYFSLPRRFDINRSIRTAYTAALRESPEDANALALKTLAEATSFAVEPAS